MVADFDVVYWKIFLLQSLPFSKQEHFALVLCWIFVHCAPRGPLKHANDPVNQDELLHALDHRLHVVGVALHLVPLC